jgi:7tm Chemosensory receptor
MSTPLYFKLIWLIFLLFAVHPYPKPSPIPPSRATHISLIIWRCFLISVSCCLVSYTFVKSTLYSQDLSGFINEIMKYLSTVLCSLVVISESFVKRSLHLNYWKLMERIQKFGKFSDIERKLNKQFAIKFWVCFSIFAGVEMHKAIEIMTINGNRWFRAWTISILPLMICRLMCLLHIYHIDLLATVFRFLQLELKDMVKFSEFSMHVKLERSSITRRLEAVKDTYGLLFKAVGYVNAIFAWSQAFNFTQIFLQSICDLHWLYRLYNEHPKPFLIIFSNYIPSYTCLFLTLRAANECVGVANSLAPLVHKIKCADDEMALDRLVLHFSSQLKYEVVTFGNGSLYTIDYGLLKTVTD